MSPMGLMLGMPTAGGGKCRHLGLASVFRPFGWLLNRLPVECLLLLQAKVWARS